eukprot:scaffold7257_cov177-Amphora_coffeaeformis.AAC.5
MMGTFPPNRDDREDDPMVILDDYDDGLSSSSRARTLASSCFQRSNSLGNDFCPHSSRLFPLMEADDELPVQSSSLRKQTAVTCLSALVETPDNECVNDNNNSLGSFDHRFPTIMLPDKSHEDDDDDEWGHFAQHGIEDYRTSNRRVQVPSRRRRPLQRRRSPAKYDRRTW